MIELNEWVQTNRFPNRPWLMLGKGPTFSRRDQFDLSDFNLLSLNHVVRELTVDVAHAIDIEVVEECADAVMANARWLLLPRRPHRGFAPGPVLEEYFDELPVLRHLDESGRLVWYNLYTSEPIGNSPVIHVRYFGSEAALNILAEMGVSRVRTLGVDGGQSYSTAFSDLDEKTRLRNGQPNFDLQFDELKGIVTRRGLELEPLVEPMRVFVGVDDSQLVPAAVLEHSIKSNTSRPVEFYALKDLSIPMPKDERNRPRTGFSFYRFAIPKLCGYKGRALYLDADMQVFGDLEELWEIPFKDHKVMCTYQDQAPEEWRDTGNFHLGRQLSVMLLDCSRLEWDVEAMVADLDAGRYTYEELMFELCVVPPHEISDDIPPEWNSLERFEPGRTKLLHYTVVPTQPWKTDGNPLAEMWMEGYRSALRAGALSPDVVLKSVSRRHVKASLLSHLGESPNWKVQDRILYPVRRLKNLLKRLPLIRRGHRFVTRITSR